MLSSLCGRDLTTLSLRRRETQTIDVSDRAILNIGSIKPNMATTRETDVGHSQISPALPSAGSCSSIGTGLICPVNLRVQPRTRADVRVAQFERVGARASYIHGIREPFA